MSEPQKPAPKRFIAGAVCPACQAIDRLVLYRENARQIYQCVACGYQEIEAFETAAAKKESEAEPLKFFPAPPKR